MPLTVMIRVPNTWTPLANIPGAFYDAPVVYAANTNSVYVFGGLDATFTPSNVTQIYNIGTGTWTTGAPMPSARYFASGAYYAGNGKVYVIAGFDSSFVESSTTWEYDPVANTWNTTRANSPIPLGGSGYSIAGQNIYLAGTWNGGTGSTVHYRYDIVANTWTAMAPVPVPIYRPDAAGIGGKTYLVGGGNPDSVGGRGPGIPGSASSTSPLTSYSTTYIYDIASNSWSNGPNTNAAHSFTGGAAIGSTLYVVGGFNGSADTNVVESLATGCPCPLRVLVVYADSTSGQPTALQSQILAEPGVTAVDLFDGVAGTPTLAQLQQYDVVAPFSNDPFTDATTLGNNLADYADAGGVVVQLGFSHYGPGQPYGVNGRWLTGNYNPYTYSTNLALSTAFTLGVFNAGHPLMAGVTTLNSNFQNVVSLAAGATQVAAASNGNSLVAYRPVSGGHTTVGITAYVGAAATQSGDWAKVIVNAGHWLKGGCAPAVVNAVSRKTHGGAGTFDINLPLTGTPGIECRTGAVAGAHQMVITFASPVTIGGASVTSGAGGATSSVSGAVVTVDLTGVTNAQIITVTLSNVNDGLNAGDVAIPMGVLSGDTNGNGSVNAGDVSQTKGQSGVAVGAGNFREDVNANGAINAGDVSLVKSRSGTSLPP